jgi:hypothetical protein
VEFKGVRSGVVRRRGVCVGIESEGPWAEGNDCRERKSSRNGVHRADAVVWGPVCRIERACTACCAPLIVPRALGNRSVRSARYARSPFSAPARPTPSASLAGTSAVTLRHCDVARSLKVIVRTSDDIGVEL